MKILNHIEPETVGVIWFSEQALDQPQEIHNIFDYVVDGRLSKFSEHAKELNITTQNENNFFISNNFDSPFILFNSHVDKDFSKNDFEDFKMILEKLGSHENKNLAVVAPSNFRLPELIKKSRFNLSVLEY